MGKSRFILPNAFTSMNFLLGVFAICWVTGAFSSFTTSDPIRTGAYFIILSVLLDKLDGFAARLVNASSEFGAQFDSLADLIAFGLAPAFTIFFTYKTLSPEWFQAYHHHFSGLPSTFAGAINAILVVYLKSNGLFENSESPMMFIPVLVMLVTGLLMVSPLFLPKLQPRRNQLFNIGQAILIVITYICGFLFISEKVPFILEYLLILCSTYLVVGFTIGLIQRKRIIENAEKNKIEERR